MNENIEDLINALPDDPTIIPDEEVFRQTFFNLNPTGDFNEAFRIFDLIYNGAQGCQGLPTPERDGNINFKFLCIKYKQYLNWWESVYSEQEQKYIPKAEKLHDPEKFLDDKLFNRVFAIPKQTKDYYMFGTYNMDTLRRKLHIFKRDYLKQDLEELPEKKVVVNTVKPKEEDEENPF